MQIDILIIGQGICGTWLSYYLKKAGKSFLIIDHNDPSTASRVTAGIVNPITGRRLVKTWMIDELIPFLKSSYTDLGKDLDITAITETQLIDFFPTQQMRNVFLERKNENNGYLHEPEAINSFSEFFHYDFGHGIIRPAFITHPEKILPAWRQLLKSNNLLLEEEFDISQMKTEKAGIAYKDISAAKIIFCDGRASAENTFFKNLPFALNKGELLLIEAPDLADNTAIFKKGIILCPYKEKNLFWVGSNYLWNFNDELPSREFREQTEQQLNYWLKVPFRIIEHKASLRPATLERRPFVGIHPVYPQIGILNGMGTKGCSLAPFFAKQLTDHLMYNTDILPEADIKRFSEILGAGNRIPTGK
jgi:glycine/D-amino acid oxidase-like deaminating enzyme